MGRHPLKMRPIRPLSARLAQGPFSSPPMVRDGTSLAIGAGRQGGLLNSGLSTPDRSSAEALVLIIANLRAGELL